MSCLGPNYNPKPTREWSRFENVCAYSNNNSNNTNLNVIKKGNILQYKNNSSNLTKNQRYSQIAKGNWTNRTINWSTQNQSYTNPNTNSLKRVNYINLNISGTVPVQTFDPLSCPKSVTAVGGSNNPNFGPIIPQYPIPTPIPTQPPYPTPTPTPTPTPSISPIIPPNPNDNGSSIPVIPPQAPIIEIPTTNKVIPDGGNLICNISQNICTGEIYFEKQLNNNCNPTSSSDIPGPVKYLCYNDTLPTYYPRTRRIFSAGGNKWPTNEKLIFSANSIKPNNK